MLIDTDRRGRRPGLLMAFNDPDTVGCLTVAAGNVGLEHPCATRSSCARSRDAKTCGLRRLRRSPAASGGDAAYVHGRDGSAISVPADVPRRGNGTPEWQSCACRLNKPANCAGRARPTDQFALALKLDPTLPQRIRRFWSWVARSAQRQRHCGGGVHIAFDPKRRTSCCKVFRI